MHLDKLFDNMQEPIAQLMDWCDADKDRAVVACLKDLLSEQGARFFEVLSEAYPSYNAFDIAAAGMEIVDELEASEMQPPDIYCAALYQPLEHIINDRTEVYNKS